MILDFNLQNVENVLNDFYKATGVNVSIWDKEFRLLYMNTSNSSKFCTLIQTTVKGRRLCHCSDVELLNKCKATQKPQQHICHAGLMDMVIPIINDFEIIGYIVMGQLKVNKDFGGVNIKSVKVSSDLFKEEYLKLPIISKEKIESVINVAVIVAKYLLLGNIIRPKKNDNLENVINFINDNLADDLSIDNISKQTFLSKSLIYVLFRKYFNITVSEYVNRQRIKKATELINTTEFSIETISSMVGYSSSSYFSKTFKRIKGVSPKKFKDE